MTYETERGRGGGIDMMSTTTQLMAGWRTESPRQKRMQEKIRQPINQQLN